MVANYRQGSGILMAVSGYIFAVTKKASLNNNYIDRVKHYTNPFFQVTEHKTAEKGPAMIALSPEIYRMVKNCIQWCKQIPGFDDDKDRNLFVSWPKDDGTLVPMTSSHVNKLIQRIWQQGPIDKHVSATRLRKATSTEVRAAVPEARETLAKHMTHSPATADRHYAFFSQRQIAMPVANLISSVMERSGPGRVNTSIHWPSRKLLAIYSTSAQNKEDCQETESIAFK